MDDNMDDNITYMYYKKNVYICIYIYIYLDDNMDDNMDDNIFICTIRKMYIYVFIYTTITWTIT